MKKHTGILLLLALWLGLSLWAWLKPADAVSDAERRPLAQFPAFSGSFSEDFAEYAADQFPMRQPLRTLKALFSRWCLGRSDNNGIYVEDGSAAQILYPLDESSLENAADRFEELYDLYLTDSSQILFATVPDKGAYLGSSHLPLPMEELTEVLETRLPWAEFVDLSSLLTADHYYRTDTHWRQETLVPVAETICRSFGLTPFTDFTAATALEEFRGVYSGQSALPLTPDRMEYLTWPGWENCTFTTVDFGPGELYAFSKLEGRDPYDFFLSGGVAIGTVENPNAATGRRLVIFRDSFGSSLAPLLAPNYRSITLVDTRYIAPDLVGDYVNFQDADILFLYSAHLLNDSSSLRPAS